MELYSDPRVNTDPVRPFVLPTIPRQEFPAPTIPAKGLKRLIPVDAFSNDPDRTTRRESEYL